MFVNETRILVILPRELVDRARRLAGQATIAMKLPVSLQIVVRALLEESLKRPGDPAVLANVKRQAEIVRRIRRESRRRGPEAGAGQASDRSRATSRRAPARVRTAGVTGGLR
jgi:hypothetical protein